MERQINTGYNGSNVDETLENLQRIARYYREHPVIAGINRGYIISNVLGRGLSKAVLSLSPEDERFSAARELWNFYEGFLSSDHKK